MGDEVNRWVKFQSNLSQGALFALGLVGAWLCSLWGWLALGFGRFGAGGRSVLFALGIVGAWLCSLWGLLALGFVRFGVEEWHKS